MGEWPYQDFGAYLDAIMEAQGIANDAELAELGHVNQTQIGRWRRGKARPSVALLAQLAEALGVPATNLYVLAGYSIGDASEKADVTVIPTEIKELIDLYNDSSVSDEYRAMIRTHTRGTVLAIRALIAESDPPLSRSSRHRVA